MTLASSRHSFLALVAVSVLSLSNVSEALLSCRPPSSSSSSSSSSCALLLTSSSYYSAHRQRHSISSSTSLHSSSGVSSQSKRKSASTKSRKKPLPNTKRTPGPGRSLSKEELTEHVSGRYMEDRLRRPLMSLDADDWDEDEESNLGNTLEQAQFLKELNRRPALVLNADFQPLSYLPLSLWSWQDAVKAIFSGKVQVVDVYPDISVRAASFEVPLPSVIALSEYVPHKNQRPAFTRRNVFLRDEYKCQYCNNRFHTADLSLDHVHPRCMGGQLTWENAVTSCLHCNGKKGSRPITELRAIGMRLIREPRCPSQMELAAKAARMVPQRVHPTWKPFLGIAETPKNSPKAHNNKQKSGDEEFIDDRYFES